MPRLVSAVEAPAVRVLKRERFRPSFSLLAAGRPLPWPEPRSRRVLVGRGPWGIDGRASENSAPVRAAPARLREGIRRKPGPVCFAGHAAVETTAAGSSCFWRTWPIDGQGDFDVLSRGWHSLLSGFGSAAVALGVSRRLCFQAVPEGRQILVCGRLHACVGKRCRGPAQRRYPRWLPAACRRRW